MRARGSEECRLELEAVAACLFGKRLSLVVGTVHRVHALCACAAKALDNRKPAIANVIDKGFIMTSSCSISSSICVTLGGMGSSAPSPSVPFSLFTHMAEVSVIQLYKI